MGLGTKIKEALSGDKAHHGDKAHGSQRRRTPGAYPESAVDIPRTATNDTWQTKKSSPVTKDDDIAEHDQIDEYTHTPAVDDSAAQRKEEEFVPSPDSRIGHHNGKLSKDYSRQPPYWGNVGKNDTRVTAANKRDVTEPLNDDRVTSDTTEDDYLGRKGTVNNNTHPALRGDVNGHERSDTQFQAPIGSVNRGRPQLVDDEAARATSMAASQVSQPTQIDSDYGNGGLSYGGAGYANGNTHVNQYDDNYGVQRSGTVNSRSPMANGRETFGSPAHHNEQRSLSPQPVMPNQPWAQGADGLGNANFAHQAGETYPQNYQAGIATRDFNSNTHQTPQKPMVQSQREQGSPANSSENGSRAGNEHYGPGHQGAKVMHRCQHCGNDNDITKYFSKDVVYRLS